MEEAVHEQWLNWAKESLIPGIMDLELFTSGRMLRVVDSPNEGVTYCLQFFADGRSSIDQYLALHNPGIEQVYREKFGQRVLSFSTVMEYVV